MTTKCTGVKAWDKMVENTMAAADVKPVAYAWTDDISYMAAQGDRLNDDDIAWEESLRSPAAPAIRKPFTVETDLGF